MPTESVVLEPEALEQFLLTRVRVADGPLAILAGHYAVFSSGGAPQDFLDGDGADAGAANAMVRFTKATWEAACRVVARAGAGKARLVVLVDDVQFVRPTLANRSDNERLAAALVDYYLERTTSLPAYHARVMAELGVDDRAVVASAEGRVVFSERALRRELVSHVRSRIVRAGASGALRSDAGDGHVMVAHPDGGEYQLVHSGHTNCAGAYIALQVAMQQSGIRHLIALVPDRCFGPVCTGAVIAPLLGVTGIRVTNIAVRN